MAESHDGEESRNRLKETSKHDASAALLEDTLRTDGEKKEQKENSSDPAPTKLPDVEFSDTEKQLIAKHYQNEILAHYEQISDWEKQKSSSGPREQSISPRADLQKELDNNTWGVASENALAEFVEWLRKDALPQNSRELKAAGLKAQDQNLNAFTSDLNFTGEPRIPNKAEVFKIETLIDIGNRATEQIQQNVQEQSYQRDLKRIGAGIPASWSLTDGQDPADYRIALRHGIAFHDRVYSAALMAYSLNKLGEHFELPAGVEVTEQQGKLDVKIDLPERLNQLSFDSRVSGYNAWVDSISNRLKKDDAALRAAGSNPFLNLSISNTTISKEVNEDGQFLSKQVLLDDDGKLIRFASSTESTRTVQTSADMSAHRFSAWRTEGSNPNSDVIAEITVQAQESRPGYDLLNKDIGDPFKLVQTLKADDPVVYNGKLINARELPELELKDKASMAAQKATDIGWDLSMFASGLGTLGKIRTGASFIAEQTGKELVSELATKSTANGLSGMNLAAVHAATETLMGAGGFLASNTWGEQNANWINSIRGTYFTANIFGSAVSSRFNRILHGTEEFQASINKTAPTWLKQASDFSAISMQVLTPLSVAPMLYEAAKRYQENNKEQKEKHQLNPLIIESNAAAGLDTAVSQNRSKAQVGEMSLVQQSAILQETLNHTEHQSDIMNALSNAGRHTPLRLLDNLYQEKIKLEQAQENANTNIWNEKANYFGNSYDDVLKSIAKFTKENSDAQAKSASALTYFFAKQLENSTDKALSFNAQLAQIDNFRSKIDEHKNDAETIEFKLNLDRLENESLTELVKYESKRHNTAQQLNQNLQAIRSDAVLAGKTAESVLTNALETPINDSDKDDSISTRVNAAETLLLLGNNDTELRERVSKALSDSVKLATAEQLIRIIDVTKAENLSDFTANTDTQTNILNRFPSADEASNSPRAQALTIEIANLYPKFTNELKGELQSRLISILEHQSYSIGLSKLQNHVAEIAAQEKMTMLIPSLEKLSANDTIPPQTREAARNSLQILKEITPQTIDTNSSETTFSSQLAEQNNAETSNKNETITEGSKQLAQIEEIFPRLKTFKNEERDEFLKSNDLSLLIHDEFIKEAQRRVQSRWGKKSMLGFEAKEDPQVTMRALQTEREFQFKRLVDRVKSAPLVSDESTKTQVECAKLTLAEIATNAGRPIESERKEYILAVNHDAGQIATYYFNESALGERNWHNEAAEALAQSAAAMPQQFSFDAHILHSLLSSKTNLNANSMSSIYTAWNKISGKGDAYGARSIDKALVRTTLQNALESIDSSASKLQADLSNDEEATAHAQSIYSRIELAERRQQQHRELEAFNKLQAQIVAALASQENR